MALPSFATGWKNGESIKPRIYVLEVRSRDKQEGSPNARLFVEREEVYRRDEQHGSIYEASIRLSYERIAPKHPNRVRGKGQFCGSYSRGFVD